jgi:hypothetical protein
MTKRQPIDALIDDKIRHVACRRYVEETMAAVMIPMPAGSTTADLAEVVEVMVRELARAFDTGWNSGHALALTE